MPLWFRAASQQQGRVGSPLPFDDVERVSVYVVLICRPAFRVEEMSPQAAKFVPRKIGRPLELTFDYRQVKFVPEADRLPVDLSASDDHELFCVRGGKILFCSA